MAMEEDDMDSLFEGMELFTPPQLAGDELRLKQNDVPAIDDDDNLPPLPSSAESSRSQSHVEAEADDAGSRRITNDTYSLPTTSRPEQQQQQQQVPEPLDEDLFSDLTFVNPLQTLPTQSDSQSLPATTTVTSPTPSQTAMSRQISRKKKRAAGLRIGYGRDASSDDLSDAIQTGSAPDHIQPSQSSSSPNDHPPTASSDTGGGVESDDGSVLLPNSGSYAEEDRFSHFEHIKSQVSKKLEVVQESAASVSAARKDSIQKRRKASEQLNLASAKYRDLELQLDAACEAEDFETAERISQSLANAEWERQALFNALKEAELLCDAIDSKMHDVLDSQIAAEQECASLLHHFSRDAENYADLLLNKSQALSSKAMEDWFSSSETLEAKRIELDIESLFVDEARHGVKDSIEHSTRNDNKEREILHKEKEMLTDDLQKLLALVKQKEKEIAENDAKIKAVEERIDNVVSGFHEIQSSIDAKYDNLQAGLSEIHLQNEALSDKRKGIDKFLAEESFQISKLKELCKVSEDESKAYQEVVELRQSLKVSILKSREDQMRLAKTEDKLTEHVQVLQQQVSAARASLQESSSSKSSIQQNISSFKQRILFIDKRVPELEAEKKVAATSRNFKEAARIASEAKSLSVEKDSVQIDLEKATSQVENLEKDIDDIITRLDETEGLISSKEKEVAMARFQRLLLVAGTNTAERFAALELGDTEEASLLLAEAEAATAEVNKIQSIYNFKEEDFSNLPKHLISMELISKLGRKQLAELAASIHVST